MTETTTKRALTLDELRARRDQILEIAARHGGSNVRVFGSVARAEADGESDVDFLIDMEPGKTLFDMGALLMDLQDFLECGVDVVTEKNLRERVRPSVLADAKSL